MKGFFRSKLVLAVVALAIVLVGSGAPKVTLAHAAGASAALPCGGWSIVPSPNASTANNELLGVAIRHKKDAWAVGDYTDASTPVIHTLTEHWDGSSWSVVPSPDAGSSLNILQKVAPIPGTKELWAVGVSGNSSGPQQTLIEHFDGTSWSIVPSPNIGTANNVLNDVVALSKSDAWAVGNSPSTQTLIEHWDGVSWSLYPSPVTPVAAGLQAITQVPETNELWAVGFAQPNTLTLHFDGTSWSIVPSPNVNSPQFNVLLGAAAAASNDVWALGSYGSFGNSVFVLALHWDGSTWSVVSTPNPGPTNNAVRAVALIPDTNHIWAVGLAGTVSTFQALIEQWDGTSWSVVSTPSTGTSQSSLAGVDARANEAWAVGSQASSGLSQTLIEHFWC